MDLNQIPALLSGLGPVGVIVGVLLVLALQYAQKRLSPPAPGPNPGPAPAPDAPGGTPILDALLNLLRLRLTKRESEMIQSFPVTRTRDIDDDTLAKLFAAVAPPAVNPPGERGESRIGFK